MKASTEPRFFVQDYITITKDPRTELVVAIGGNGRAADILQRAGRFPQRTRRRSGLPPSAPRT